MQEQLNVLQEDDSVPFTDKIKGDLQKTAQWAKISAVLALSSVVVVFVQTVIQGGVVSAIIMEAGNIAIVICLLYFGIYTKKGIETIDQNAFEKGLKNLMLYFKTLGIIVITVIGLVLLVTLISLLVGVKPFFYT